MSTLFRQQLEQMGACTEAVEWVGERSLEQAWRECERGDWMIWLLEATKADEKIMAAIACDCAERVLHLARDKDREACRIAIETRRAWIRGDATEAECQKASDAAWAAAAEAAWAAADAAWAAAAEAAWATAEAAWAAADAAWAAAAEAAWATAEAAAGAADAAEYKAQADIVRKHVRWQQMKKAMEEV